MVNTATPQVIEEIQKTGLLSVDNKGDYLFIKLAKPKSENLFKAGEEVNKALDEIRTIKTKIQLVYPQLKIATKNVFGGLIFKIEE